MATYLDAMARVADDMVNRRLVLGDIWDVDGKRGYLDSLERDGVLPNAQHTLSKPKQKTCRQKPYEQTQQWLRNHIREQHSFPKKILV